MKDALSQNNKAMIEKFAKGGKLHSYQANLPLYSMGDSKQTSEQIGELMQVGSNTSESHRNNRTMP